MDERAVERDAKARASVVASINVALAGLEGARTRLGEAESRQAQEAESAELEYSAAVREADEALRVAVERAQARRRERLHAVESELGTARALVRKRVGEYRELRARLDRLLPDIVGEARSSDTSPNGRPLATEADRG